MSPEQRALLHRIADRSLGHSKPLEPHQEAVKERVLDYALTEEAPCFCGEMRGWDYETQDRHGFQMTLRLCSNCGLLRTNPRPTEQTLDRYYQEDFRALYTAEAGALWSSQTETSMDLVKLFPGAESVVDIGCGTGGTLRSFAKEGAECVGFDLDREYLEYGRERESIQSKDSEWPQHNPVELVAGGWDGSTKADLVIASHTLEHRADLRTALLEHRNALTPGGEMFAAVPTIETIRTHYGEDFQRYLSWAHLWHFTADTFRYVLWACGLVGDVTWDGVAVCERDHDFGDDATERFSTAAYRGDVAMAFPGPASTLATLTEAVAA